MLAALTAGGPRGERRGPVVLIAPVERAMDALATRALHLARVLGRDLHVVRPALFPDQTPLDGVEARLGPHRRAVQALLSSVDPGEVAVSGDVRVGHHVEHVVREAAEASEASLLLVPSLFPLGPDEVAGRDRIEAMLEAVACPAVACREPPTQIPVDSVLAAVAGGPHSHAVARFALALGEAEGADVTLCHVEAPDQETEPAGRRLLDAIAEAVDAPGAVERIVHPGADVVDGVLAVAADYDALVVGAPTQGRLRRWFYGSRSRAMRGRSPGWVFTMHAGGHA